MTPIVPRDASESAPCSARSRTAPWQAALSPSTVATPRAHPERALSRSISTVSVSTSPGTTGRRKRTSSTPASVGICPREAIVGQQGDPARLGERFDLEDAREHRIPGEVPGEGSPRRRRRRSLRRSAGRRRAPRPSRRTGRAAGGGAARQDVWDGHHGADHSPGPRRARVPSALPRRSEVLAWNRTCRAWPWCPPRTGDPGNRRWCALAGPRGMAGRGPGGGRPGRASR